MALAFSTASKALEQPIVPANTNSLLELANLPQSIGGNDDAQVSKEVMPASNIANMFWREHLNQNKRNLLNGILDYNCGIDVNQVNRNGHSALFDAILELPNKKTSISLEQRWIKKLIAHGADINQKFSYFNAQGKKASHSSFEITIINNDYDMFSTMLPLATVNLEALHLAIQANAWQMVASLVANGAPIDNLQTRTLLKSANKATQNSFDLAAHAQLFMMCQADSNANNLAPKLKM